MRTIIIGDKSIQYQLTRKNVKNINFRMKNSQILHISVPKWFPENEIEKVILQKTDFILSTIDKIKSRNNNLITLDDTDEILLFGDKLTISILESNNNTIKIKDNNLIIATNDNSFINKKEMLYNLITNNGKTYFNQINMETSQLFKKYNLPIAKLRYRKMKNTLGNCRPAIRTITINKKLALMPRSCTEYVFIHEYSHFIHSNHSKSFYDIVETILPDYKNYEKKLTAYLSDINYSGL